MSLRVARAACVAVVVVAGFHSAARGEDWTRFRGPDGSATAIDGDAPTTWSASQNLLWRAELPGPGSSCPITFGDKIFLTAYSGYGLNAEEPGEIANLRLHVLCVDRRKGTLLWDRAMPATDPQPYEGQVTNHGYATPTPVTDGEAVYSFFGCSGVVAHDFDGNELWRTNVGSKTTGFGSAASPILWRDTVIVNASIESQSLVALHKRTGQEVWRVSDVKRAWNTPLVVDVEGGPSELILNCENTLRSFDPDTGDELWTCEAIKDYVCPSAVLHDGVVYVIGGRPREALAVRPGGRGDVTATHRLWFAKSGANVTSPVVHEGHIYFLDDRGVFHCVRAEDGEIVYRERMPAGNRVYASVALAGDKLYAVSRDQGTFVVRANPEKYEEVALNKLDGDDSLFNASPTIDDGQIFLRSDKYLYCIAAPAVP